MSSKQSSFKTIVPGNRSLDEIFEEEAHQIVDEAIDNAMKRLRVNLGNVGQQDEGNEEQGKQDEEKGTVDPETGAFIPNIKWMSAENFTVAGGLEKVEEFIKVSQLN